VTALSAIVAAVMARVTLEVPAVTYAEGSQESSAHDAPPRCTWKRTQRRPRNIGQSHGDPEAPYQRAILGLAQGYEVRLWAADLAALDALFNAFIRALEYELSGHYEYEGDEHVERGVVAHGEATVVRVSLECHVPEQPPATVTITSTALIPGASPTPGDGALDLGDP
jgi:hypothetical protein